MAKDQLKGHRQNIATEHIDRKDCYSVCQASETAGGLFPAVQPNSHTIKSASKKRHFGHQGQRCRCSALRSPSAHACVTLCSDDALTNSCLHRLLPWSFRWFSTRTLASNNVPHLGWDNNTVSFGEIVLVSSFLCKKVCFLFVLIWFRTGIHTFNACVCVCVCNGM